MRQIHVLVTQHRTSELGHDIARLHTPIQAFTLIRACTWANGHLREVRYMQLSLPVRVSDDDKVYHCFVQNTQEKLTSFTESRPAVTEFCRLIRQLKGESS
jgi:hypothetical protein